MKSLLVVSFGFIFLGLGVIGLVLPVWPTTPFVILAAGCFSGSPRIRNRIMRINFFREHIENYAKREGLSKRTVGISLGYLWGMLLLSMVLMQKLWLTLLLLVIGIAVTIHILCMAAAKEEKL